MAKPNQSTTQEGDTNRPVGGSRRQQKPKKSQLDRVLGWDPSHLAAVLQAGGVQVPDFQKLGRFQQAQTVRQALEAYKNQNNPAYFAQPMTGAQANMAADAATNLKYGGVESALAQQVKQTPEWYAQYKQSVQGAQKAAQAYQQGLVDQSQQVATQIGQAVLQGVDPNSPAAQNDQLAAKSRQALGNLGTDLIRAGGAANDQYFGSRAGVADASQMGAMAKLFQQQQQLASEKGDYRTSTLNDLRQNAANNYLAQQTLAGNQANMASDNAFQAANAAQTAADKKAARVVQRKNARDRLAATENRQATADQKAADKAAEKQAAADAKKHATIRTAVGKVKNKIQDIRDEWARGGTVEYTVQQKDPKTGKVKNVKKTRPITRDELRGELQRKYGSQMVSIMERVRKGQAITSAQANYLHNLDPDFRVPSEWRRGRKTDLSRGTGNPASSQGTGLG